MQRAMKGVVSAVIAVTMVGCGQMAGMDDAGAGGGTVQGGGRAGGAAGGAAGGLTAGGEAGGGEAGGSTAGGSAAGGTAGGALAGGSTAGGSAGGASAGGSTAGGSAGGASAGGSTAGGSAGGASAGGSTAGGSAGGASAGGSTGGGEPFDGGSTGDGGTTPDAGCLASAEVCDGLDNDCNGLIDEGVTLSCLSDEDNDRYATSATVTQACADPTRSAAGNCPVGFVSPAASLGTDCAPIAATTFRLVTTRGDSDSDGACAGAAVQECVGATLPTGRVLSSSCSATDDCNDSSASVFRSVQLRVDADNDLACIGATQSVCAGLTTPTGYRLPASCSATDDCNDTDASKYLIAMVQPDADGDRHCTGTAVSQCIGTTAPAGYRFPADCLTLTDCNDISATVFVSAQLRADADNDTVCAGATQTLCIGALTPTGFRAPNTCMNSLGDDCADMDPTRFFVGQLQPDADGDGYCTATTTSLCTGNTAPTGYRFPANCITQSDCNDANGSIYRLLSVRPDQDNDGYCFGPATNQCSGANPPTGFRLPATCNATDDCRDLNPAANVTCLISGGYVTTSATKTCAFVPPTESFTVSTTSICPLGFTLGGFSAVRLSGTGSCTATSQTSLSMTCNVLDGATCRIEGFCTAL